MESVLYKESAQYTVVNQEEAEGKKAEKLSAQKSLRSRKLKASDLDPHRSSSPRLSPCPPKRGGEKRERGRGERREKGGRNPCYREG